MGSSNAGMTNVLRSVGKKEAVGTAVCDLLKGIVAALAGYFLVKCCTDLDPQLGSYAAGTMAVVGHCYPVFYGFRGGKGVLTVTGAVLIIDPLVVLILGLVFLTVLLITKTISICSVSIAVGYPIVFVILRLIFHQSFFPGLWFSFFLSALIIFRHRSNIKRLIHGEESKVSVKK